MSEDMVKRVAIAIGDLIIPAVSGGSSVTIGTVARAAIEAMRAPTDEMIVTGDDEIIAYLNDERLSDPDNTPSKDCWQAMISAALKEQTK